MFSVNIKLLSHMKQNSITNLVFIKFTIFVRGGHRDYSPRAPKKNLAPPLNTLRSKEKKRLIVAVRFQSVNISNTHSCIVTSRIDSIT